MSLAPNRTVSRQPVIPEIMPAGNLRTSAVDVEFLPGLVIVADACCMDYLCIQKAIICYIGNILSCITKSERIQWSIASPESTFCKK